MISYFHKLKSVTKAASAKQISVSEVWSGFWGDSVISKDEPFVVRTNFPTKNPRGGGGFRGSVLCVGCRGGGGFRVRAEKVGELGWCFAG